MRIYNWLPAAFALAAHAESHTLTLKQAVERALTQNPEAIMARMDVARAVQTVRLEKVPFSTRVTGGSGLAYSNGFPLSIEGSAPAVFEARANQTIYNRPQTYAVAQSRENLRGAGFASAERSDEIAFRVAGMYIDLERAGRLTEGVRKQVESLDKVLAAVTARVEAGRELAVVRQEANVNLLRARQRLMAMQADFDYSGHNLAVTLGFDGGDTVSAVEDERSPAAIPDSEDAALKTALGGSKELKRLESNYQAKALEIKGDKAQRLPRVDLVAQYALFAKYSNLNLYFNRFKYNNGQIGASVQIPLLLGPGANAQVRQGEAEQQHIRAEIQAARGRIELAIHQSYQEIEKAEMARQVTKAELDLAHEQLSIALAQMNEGRVALKQVEEARFAEDEKWIAFYDAQFSAEKARLNVLRQTGELAAVLR